MPFPASQDSRISRFYDYWSGLRSGRRLPTLDAIDPVDLAPLLPTLWVAGWDDEARDFVYRLAGERVLQVFRRPIRHQPLGAIYSGPVAETLRERYKRICTEPAAYYGHGHIYGHVERYGIGERLVLPLSDKYGRPKLVVGCTIYTPTAWPVGQSGVSPRKNAEIGQFTSLDGSALGPVRAAG